MKFNEKHLQLICGDPRKKPAAFSRFVFPFAYEPEKIKTSSSKGDGDNNIIPHYREFRPKDKQGEIDPKLQDRMNYFTPEINSVLFGSAKWLELDPDAWSKTSWSDSVKMDIRGKTLRVSMLPPRLVLFEWPFRDGARRRKHGGGKTLQTGFLILDLYFMESLVNDYAVPELDDLLKINDLFRLFRYPYPKLAEEYEKALADVPVIYPWDARKDAERKIGSPGVSAEEQYLYRWTRLLHSPVYIDGDCWRLFPNSTPEPANLIDLDPKTRDFLLPYADSRAYVWSAVILDKGAGALRKAYSTSNWRAHRFGHWIRLLNVDPPDDSGCPGKTHHGVMRFERKWARDRTYHRWEEWGTWYGFSYHSGVMLGPPWKEPDTPVWRHFRHMYFDMALLLLYIRISIFRFSRRLSEMTESQDIYDSKSRTELENLRGIFSIFTIRYQFPLLSNQQQAIEMYALAREHFDIDDLYREVKQEIDHTHELIDTIHQKQSSETANKIAKEANYIAKYGIPLAAGALVASIFGMNADEYPLLDWARIFWENLQTPHGPSLTSVPFHLRMTSISFLVLLLIVLLVWLIFFCKFRNKEKKND